MSETLQNWINWIIVTPRVNHIWVQCTTHVLSKHICHSSGDGGCRVRGYEKRKMVAHQQETYARCSQYLTDTAQWNAQKNKALRGFPWYPTYTVIECLLLCCVYSVIPSVMHFTGSSHVSNSSVSSSLWQPQRFITYDCIRPKGICNVWERSGSHHLVVLYTHTIVATNLCVVVMKVWQHDLQGSSFFSYAGINSGMNLASSGVQCLKLYCFTLVCTNFNGSEH